MTAAEAKQIVDYVLNTNQNEVSKGELLRRMVDLGADPEDALSILKAINEGFKAGTLAVVTGGLATEDYVPGQNIFFDLAFRKGKAAMRFTTPLSVLVKFLVLLVVAAVIIGSILYAVLR